jgi:alpha-mannosidase
LRDPEPDASSPARTVRWSIVPFEGPEVEADLMQAAFEALHPPRAITTDAHEGFRPARHAFIELVRVTPEGSLQRGAIAGVVVTGLASPESGTGFQLRLFETHGRGGELLVDVDRPVFGARRVDLLGRDTVELKPEPKRLRVRLDPWRIETLRWSWRP